MIAECFAKINLYLNISHKRPDGFHEIQSLFHTISLFDTLKISPSNNFNLSISPTSSSFVNANVLVNDNILEKVYNFFKNEYGIFNVRVELKKKIPMGAGLGGGSSNAAGFIQALNKLNNLNLNEKELKRIGALFGSDVPFFIHGGFCRVTGRGEKIEPLSSTNKKNHTQLQRYKKIQAMPMFPVVLIYPEIHISTQEAYDTNNVKNKDVNFERVTIIYQDYPLSNGEAEIKQYIDKIKDFAYNSFENKVLNKYSKVFEVYTDLKKYSNYVLMSGSGSCVFAIFSNEYKSADVAKRLRKKYKYTYHIHTNNKGASFT